MNLNDLLQPVSILSWLVSLPLLAAVFSIVMPRFGVRLGYMTAIITSVMIFCLGGEIVSHGAIEVQFGGWQAPLGITLYADGLSAVLLAITAIVFGSITFYAHAYFKDHVQAYSFWPLWFFLWSALNALFLSADIFNLYVTLELLGLSAVALVAFSQSEESLSAAMRYLLVSLTGSLIYLMGVAFIYATNGSLNLHMLAPTGTLSLSFVAAFALIVAGLAMKSALFPMHFWLPPAHANAPAPVSAVLSALVVKASFYILVRLWVLVFQPFINTSFTHFLGFLGGAAIIWGSLQALVALRLKLLVAYSTVAQVGYLFLVFPLSSMPQVDQMVWNGGLYFILSHACAKSAIFLTAGTVISVYGHDRIDDLQGIVHQLPVSMFAFAMAGVSLIGLPPSSGFIAKWIYLNASLSKGQWWWSLLIVIGSLLSAAYIFRFFSRAFKYTPKVDENLPPSRIMEWTAFFLALCSILLGLFSPSVIHFLQAGNTF
jgi:formate hydrogenlyase subunit 3/multisubunit Na+/H+ antiporter MnhD subunit